MRTNNLNPLTDSRTPESPQIDLSEARTFLDYLDNAGQFTFQTFGEPTRDRTLNKILHGDLDKHGATLERLNAAGAGVFVMINSGDSKGRSKLNVVSTRAVFVDLDGAPLEPITQAALPPHVTVESSPGKYHAYWLVLDLPCENFTATQLALALRFDGDHSVKDLPRVMRLPGFIHRKDHPFRTHLIEVKDIAPYSANQLLTAFGIDPTTSQQTFCSEVQIKEGARNNAIFQMATTFMAKCLPNDEVLTRLLSANKARCKPPLREEEVRNIWERSLAYRPANNPLVSLFDSPRLVGLSHSTRLLYYLAVARSQSSTGTFSMTLMDCEAQKFSRRQRQRGLFELIEAGLLIQVRPHFGGIGGGKRQCALFSLGVV